MTGLHFQWINPYTDEQLEKIWKMYLEIDDVNKIMNDYTKLVLGK